MVVLKIIKNGLLSLTSETCSTQVLKMILHRYTKIRFSLFCLVIILSSISAFSSNQVMRFVSITPETGLSNGNIVSILQDHEGYMWIGTAEGLNKYDGLKFEIFKNIHSDTTTLSGNYIFALLEDQQNDLWIGTDNGLCRYNREMNNFERIEFPDKNQQTFRHKVGALFEDQEGRIWIGSNNGAYLLDYPNKKFVPYLDSLIQGKEISEFETDNNGNLIISFHDLGLLINNIEKGTTELINTNHLIYPLKENNIYTIDVDAQNRIWIGYYSKGISMIDFKGKKIKHFEHEPNNNKSLSNNFISDLCVDKNNNVIIGTNGGGLSVFDNKTKTFSKYVLSEAVGSIISNSINTLYYAPDGMIWIGGWGSGLSVYDKRLYKFTYYNHEDQNNGSLSGQSVTSFAEDFNSNIWISTDGGGIDCFDTRTQRFTNYKSTNNKVLALCTDNDGDLWSGMWNGGLNHFEINGNKLKIKNSYPKINSSQNSNTSIFYLNSEANGKIWIGTFQAGVHIFDKNKQQFTSLSELIGSKTDTIKLLTVNNIKTDLDGDTWISTQDFGLLNVNLENKSFHLYTQNLNDSLGQPAKLISFTHQDHQKRLWIGTNVGLSLFNKTKETFITYTVADGLPDNNIVGMLEDDKGNLWVSSNKGLSKITVHEALGAFPQLEIRNYGITDGLQGNLFNRWAFFKSSTGHMYFGGLNGFNVFHPDSITDNTQIPPVRLTDFYLFNQKQEPGNKQSILKKHLSQTNEVILKHDQNFFSIRFVALNYIMSEKNEYAYMLEGLDKDWIYVKNKNEATYTLLKPGKYTFKVKASNNDGYWNENGATVKIIILPPWWQTWWFYSILAFLLLLSIVYFTLKIVAHYRKLANQTILNERNQLQTLIDNIPEQVFIKDINSRFVVVNKRTAEHWGFDDPKQMINKTDYDLYTKEEADYFAHEEKMIIESRVPSLNMEAESRNKKSERYYSITKCPIINSKDETIGLVGIIRDITNQKKAELQIIKQSRELQKMNQALSDNNQLLEERQRLIEEQAEELYNQKEELLSSNKQLNELNATKDKLFSIIAHDVKNPFNIIMGFSELLVNNIENWSDNEKVNAANLIYDSSNKLSTMLENLLQWARNQRGMVECFFEVIEAKTFVNNQINFFKYNLDQKKITITTNLPDNNPIILADKQLLDTIFRNLIGNAIKFTPKGGAIEIGLKTEGKLATFNVSDNGVGIPTDSINKIFDIKEQKTTLGTNNEKGTGLGLILVKEFVEKQGGTIWVESTEGKGTDFYFTVPMA